MADFLPENHLLQRESEPLELEDEPAPELERALSLTLAGKLLANQRPSLSNLTYFASKQWECPNRLKVYDHGRGLYSFEFVRDADVLKVVNGGPWFIEGKLLLIQRVNPNLSINQLAFETTKIWVRCYDLPPKAFNTKLAAAIGNMLGSFCDSDLQIEGAEQQAATISKLPTVRKFLRIKIVIKLSMPLKRTQNLKIRNSAENRVDEIITRLAYERLPLFCYRCGLLGHDLDSCSIEGPILYNERIRAEKYYRAKSTDAQVEVNQEHDNQNIQPQAVPEIPVVPPNPLTLDPNIILANFRQFREDGILPPVPQSLIAPQFGSLNNALIPYESDFLGVPASQAPITTTEGEVVRVTEPAPENANGNGNSILGAIPAPITKDHRPPTHPRAQEVHKSFVPSYYNPSVPSADLFSPSPQRCLFNSELMHPALSSHTKAPTISPPELSPINSPSSFLNSPEAPKISTVVALPALGGDVKGKGVASSRGKRSFAASSSKSVDSPKPKRGRPPSGSSKNA